jgi:hypothetical protein
MFKVHVICYPKWHGTVASFQNTGTSIPQQQMTRVTTDPKNYQIRFQSTSFMLEKDEGCSVSVDGSGLAAFETWWLSAGTGGIDN